MAHDEALATRIRKALGPRPDVVEQKMFGGLVFMVGGKMLCGVLGEDLMVRVGPAALEAALARPHARVMTFTGRPSRNLVYVGPAGARTVAAVRAWVERALAFTERLPAKPKRKAKPRPRPRAKAPRR